MILIFYSALILIFMTYPGYILFLILMRAFFARRIEKNGNLPSVSIIIAAYNEEKFIEKKILNTFELEYDKDLLEIFVASDGSTDETERIVESYKDRGVSLVKLEKRGGKTAAQNECIKYVNGEIVVFSDADVMYGKNAIQQLVSNFNSADVGCVGGRLVYGSGNQIELIKEKKLYSSFDQFIKKIESDIHSCIGVDGAIYAIRKELVRPLPENLTSDFYTAIDVISQGYRVIYEENAFAFAEVASSSKAEFKRKIRTVRAGVTVLSAATHILSNPIKYFWPALFLCMHKLMRWIFFVFLVAIFVSNALTSNASLFLAFAFYLQLSFYIFALIGFCLRKTFPLKIFTIPYYFCMYNICAAVGIYQFFFGTRSERWEIER